MSPLIQAIVKHATDSPFQPALVDGGRTVNYRELALEIDRLAALLKNAAPRAVALMANNSVAWALADLAALAAEVPLIPVPAYFSATQLRHVVATAGIDIVLTDQPLRTLKDLQVVAPDPEPFVDALRILRLSGTSGIPIPAGTSKVTFTSGTTGTPKGVCLFDHHLGSVAGALLRASDARPSDRHLCLLPLSTLLENIAGIHVPLMAGATACIPTLAEVGMSGSSGFDVLQAISALTTWRATTALTVPQMLGAFVSASRAGISMSRELRYMAVGGAPVPPSLLSAALAAGLPVHEGYGLSECGSVVAVNRPRANRPGSVGKPLEHVRVRIASDGEILVEGARWGGYLGDPLSANDHRVVATGDLGRFDDDGFLYVTGRKRDVFITSFGRNVAPDWIENVITAHPGILQAFVVGEGRPFNSAVLVLDPTATSLSVERALSRINDGLPDYAQVSAWIPADEPFSPTNAMLTFNGRLRRDAILKTYAERLDLLYRQPRRRKPRVVLQPLAVGHAR